MALNNLRPPKGMKHAKKRIGRGQGSGNGKTAGRGHKGAKSRSGFTFKRGFEGGQMPLHRRLPKRGFTPLSQEVLNEVNLGRIQIAIDAGKLDAAQPVTLERLIAAGAPLDGASDHGVSEALYLRDPDDNRLELYWDRPQEVWPCTPQGDLAMFHQTPCG